MSQKEFTKRGAAAMARSTVGMERIIPSGRAYLRSKGKKETTRIIREFKEKDID